MITDRPSRSASLVGGAITLPEQACAHGPARPVAPWTGEPGTAGTVTVVGAGKMGLPLAAQFASHGWSVIAVDVNPDVVAAINAGRSHVAEEPGLAERVAAEHAAGRLQATTDGAAAARDSDVVVLIVPVMLDDAQQPDYRHMDAAVDAVAPGVRAGATVIFETTLPVGDTRHRYVPRLEAVTGLVCRARPLRRVLPGAALHRRGLPQPRDVPQARGGHRPGLDREGCRVLRSGPGRRGGGDELGRGGRDEQARRHDVPRPQHRPRQRARRYASRIGVDVLEVIRAANSQPYSHIHQPGLGVGGHCIPVYPHFLLSRAPEMELVALARRVNDGQVGVAVEMLRAELVFARGGPGPRRRPHVPRGRPGAGLLAGAAAHRRAGGGRSADLRLGSASRRVGGRRPGRRAVDVGYAERRPGDRRPDGRSGVPRARSGLMPRLEVVLDGRNGLDDVGFPAGIGFWGSACRPGSRIRPRRAGGGAR